LTGIAANEARPNLTLWSPGGTEGGAMSADGRFVVFDSRLTNLVYGDYNGANDVFLRDRQTGELRRVSVASDGSEGYSDSAFAKISKNGKHIAFWSCATNFDPADASPECDLFIHDREAGTTVLANLGPNGEQATSTTQLTPSITPARH
jgi:Tol biopolymer transport system component